MQHIFDIHDYDENFIEQFCSHTIPIYDLWSIRPLENQQKEILTGSSGDADKFRSFISDHANKDYPHPIVIIVGNAESSNPKNILNNTRRYFKLKFDKYKGNDLGSPLPMGYAPALYPNAAEQMIPLSFSNAKTKNPSEMLFSGLPNQGMSYSEIQGIIDRNVTDATRSIKAEYEELSAKREAESIKRLAELETKMELYKLDLKASEIQEKERSLNQQIELFEKQKLEGLGSVKDYTKTIASGLLELGKSAFGIQDSKKINTDSKSKTDKVDLKGTSGFDDDGFYEAKIENNIPKENNSFNNLLESLKTLSQDQKYLLLDVLMPDDTEDEIQNQNQEEIIKNEVYNEESNQVDESTNTKIDEDLQTEN